MSAPHTECEDYFRRASKLVAEGPSGSIAVRTIEDGAAKASLLVLVLVLVLVLDDRAFENEYEYEYEYRCAKHEPE